MKPEKPNETLDPGTRQSLRQIIPARSGPIRDNPAKGGFHTPAKSAQTQFVSRSCIQT
jgi:hypothetical protein